MPKGHALTNDQRCFIESNKDSVPTNHIARELGLEVKCVRMYIRRLENTQAGGRTS